MTRIDAEMFQFDNGSVREKSSDEILSKIVELSKHDPKDYKLDGNRANLMLIRRLAKKLEKLV